MAGDDRPRALILSVFGAFLRRLGGWMSIASLIDLMEELGIEEQAVRSSISRLKRRGVVASERRRALAGYQLTEEGLQILREGDRRIYGRPPRATLADGWVLATFSVPDSERAQRHLLRMQLAWLGFGNFSPGIWLAPSHVADEARAALARTDLSRYVHLFHAHYVAFDDPVALVRACWDLEGLASRYRHFCATYERVLETWRRGTPALDARTAFVDHMRALTAWRRLPFLDPGLPPETLPATWPGERAWTVFHELIDQVDERSFHHVTAIAGRAARDATGPPVLAHGRASSATSRMTAQGPTP